ncbi:MAG TPA: hypothetical protein PKC67_07045 [Kiritimatiellia bacterium]|nr:hypothetical protein [Kiritimatiellia bacterium]HMP34094.1 hypothetical protein [Kiritimatiellia bacterium]
MSSTQIKFIVVPVLALVLLGVLIFIPRLRDDRNIPEKPTNFERVVGQESRVIETDVQTPAIMPPIAAPKSYQKAIEAEFVQQMRGKKASGLDARYREINPPDPECSPEQRTRVNDAMTAMVLNHEAHGDLHLVLSVIALDENVDVVVRDYSVQHLATLWPVLTREEKQHVNDVFVSLLKEKQNTIAGTVLLGMHRTRQLDKVDAMQNISELALAVAADESYGPMSRATALQVCAEMNMSEAIPLAISSLGPANSPFLKKSAAHALRQFQAVSDSTIENDRIAQLLENCHDCN